MYCILQTRRGKTLRKKKNISLKQWLEIYAVYAYKEYDKLYGKNIYFKQDGVTMIQYKVLKFQLHVVQRLNETNIVLPKIITKNNFIGFMQNMRDFGWTIVVET